MRHVVSLLSFLVFIFFFFLFFIIIIIIFTGCMYVRKKLYIMLPFSNMRCSRSLQKVQGHRTAQDHRAGVDVDVTPLTGGPVGPQFAGK